MTKLFSVKYFIFLFIILFLNMIQLLDLYRIFDDPSEALYYELSKKESFISDKKVEYFISRGADPRYSDRNLNNTDERYYSFTLTRAIGNNRINIIPLLKADYTKEQKEMAFILSKGNE